MKWPFVWRKDYEKLEAEIASVREAMATSIVACNNSLKNQQKQHEKLMEERTARVAQILESWQGIEWDRPMRGNATYRLALDIDPRMVEFGGMPSQNLEILADHISRRVHREIMTSKFVKDAHDTMMRREHNRGVFPF